LGDGKKQEAQKMSSIDLTPDNSKFIESLIVSGKASSTGQALNMAVDLLKRKVEVFDAVQVGIQQADNGDLLSADDVFGRIEKRAAQIAKSSREG
jgi:antitoxin ParD1/3/4